MPATELITGFVRFVIFAAGLIAIPIVYRSGGRWRTYVIILCGLASVSIPAGLQILQHLSNGPLPPVLAAVGQFRVEEAGYATILVGLLAGLRDLRSSTDALRQDNLTLKQLASTDFLTGLLSRRQAELLLEHGAARARRSGSPLGFIMIDLDHFKKVNDTYGHLAGDYVLSRLTRVVIPALRTEDVFARYGGEEFAILSRATNPPSASIVADRVRALVEAHTFEFEHRKIPMTISVGLAAMPHPAVATPDDLIALADKALYEAKHAGRNRVVHAAG